MFPTLALVSLFFGLATVPASAQEPLAMPSTAFENYVKDAAQALVDKADVLVIGSAVAKRTVAHAGILFTYFEVAVDRVISGVAPQLLTVRVDGGSVPGGEWQDYQSFTIDVGQRVLLPLHAAGESRGIGPAEAGVYFLDQYTLGHVLNAGALQAADANFPVFPPCVTDACGENVRAQTALNADVTEAVADLYVTIDDTVSTLLKLAVLPTVSLCGGAQIEALCFAADAKGSPQPGQYDAEGYWESRYLTASYKVNPNTPDLVGEQSLVVAGADDWTGTYWSSTYTGTTTAVTPNGTSGVVYWTPSDIDALARGGTNGGYGSHGNTGFVIYFGDQYRWSNGAKVGAYDIASVTRHEMGHVLGLGHSAVKTNIMFPTIDSNSTKGLGAGDIAGLNFIYTQSDYRAGFTAQSDAAVSVLPGTGSKDVVVSFQNLGRTPWNLFAIVNARTASPFARCSAFDGSGAELPISTDATKFVPWASCSAPRGRVTNLSQSTRTVIERGESAQVTFRFNAPLTMPFGNYMESFNLDVAGPLSISSNAFSFIVSVGAT